MPFAPGTLASLVTMLLVFFVRPYWEASPWVHILAIVVVFFLGIPAALEAERYFKKEDPGQCVIDEVMGQMIALLFVPHQIEFYIAGFVLFRIFDILKPVPVSTLERVHGGWGVMLDDAAAGLYALCIMQLCLYVLK